MDNLDWLSRVEEKHRLNNLLPVCWICGSDADSGCHAYAGCQNRECKNHGNRDRETWVTQAENHRLREALNFYAESRHPFDGGEVARKALEEPR